MEKILSRPVFGVKLLPIWHNADMGLDFSFCDTLCRSGKSSKERSCLRTKRIIFVPENVDASWNKYPKICNSDINTLFQRNQQQLSLFNTLNIVFI